MIYSGARHRRRSALIVVAAAATASLGCASGDGISIRVAGTITRASTGQPVAGAFVRMTYDPLDATDPGFVADTQSDSSGHYELDGSNVPCRNITVSVHLGFQPGFASVECTNRPQQIDFALGERSFP